MIGLPRSKYQYSSGEIKKKYIKYKIDLEIKQPPDRSGRRGEQTWIVIDNWLSKVLTERFFILHRTLTKKYKSIDKNIWFCLIYISRLAQKYGIVDANHPTDYMDFVEKKKKL